jgi:hypothetical protein
MIFAHICIKLLKWKKVNVNAISPIMQGKARQFSLLFAKTSFCTHLAQVKIQTIAFLLLQIILKGQHHENYIDYHNKLIAYHLGILALQMLLLFAQINIYQ